MRPHIRAAIALLGAVVSPLSGQTPDSARKAPTRIIGVFDARTGEPLSDVQVRDSLTGTYAVTTATGTAPLNFLTFRRAVAVVELRKLGYQPKQFVVKLADSTAITATLEPVVTLAPVVTTAKYRIDRDEGRWDGFNQRCLSKSVTCIRNEDLEKRPSANIADFLMHADGVTIGACGGGSQRNGQCGRIAMRPTVIPPSFCQPTFFVDGFEWNSRMGAPTDLAPHRPAQGPYTPTNVKAIEVYPPGKTRPLRFEGDPLCGAVVIWTK